MREGLDGALDAEAAKDDGFRKVRGNYETFRTLVDAWDGVTEDAYRQYFTRAGE